MFSNTQSLFSDKTYSLEERRATFLHSLRGQRLAYKRYTKSPLRYPGGKSLAVGIILEYFPKDINRVISPFFGGGSVEIACASELRVKVVGFDIFDILVNFWQFLIRDSKTLYDDLLQLPPTKEQYAEIKEELKKHWKKEIVLDSRTLARDYYFNFNLSYGPGFLGWMSKIYESPQRYLNMIEKIRNFNGENLSVECSSFEKVFEEYPNDFFYLDPPYFLEGDSKMFRGIYPQRNFPIHHNNFPHDKLAELLKNHKGKFVLSYNDCQWVREAYKDFKLIDVSWQYTMGQGETRIGKNRIDRGDFTNVKQSHELLIVKE